MAETKKATAKAVAVKSADAAKKEEVKTTVTAAKEEPKAAEEPKTTAKAAAKKPAAKKTAAKKTTTKKAAAKKTTAKETTAKTAGRKAAAKADVSLQFADGQSYTEEQLVKIAKDVWQYDLERKPEDFKKVSLYVKPEERKVYYVVNDEVDGSFGI